jgi:beta-xylosidase
VLRSRDLVHWTIVGHVLPKCRSGPLYDMPGPHSLDDTISKPIGGTKYASGVWAPAIRHHDGKFWVFFPTPDEGIFMSNGGRSRGPVERAGAGHRRGRDTRTRARSGTTTAPPG